METVPVRYEQLSVDEGFLNMPEYENMGRVAIPLHAFFPSCIYTITLNPGERKTISAGIKIRIPEGYEGQIRPVAWQAETFGVTVLDSPASIDSNHTDVVRVNLINHGNEPFSINYCSHIADLVLIKVARVCWVLNGGSEDHDDPDCKLEEIIVDNHVSVIVRRDII